MRTTLDLDDHLLTSLVSRHPQLTKTAAIEIAIRTYLKETATAELRRLAGDFDIDDVSKQRRRDRHT